MTTLLARYAAPVRKRKAGPWDRTITKYVPTTLNPIFQRKTLVIES